MTPDTRNKLKDQLARDEGVRFEAYKDSVGIWTIGIGRNLEAKALHADESQMIFGQVLDKTTILRKFTQEKFKLNLQQVYYILDNDIKEAEEALFNALPWVAGLDEIRQAVLINMSFNMGMATLLKFENTLNLIKDGNYKLASKNMLMSRWAKQVGARADRLASQMRDGKTIV